MRLNIFLALISISFLALACNGSKKTTDTNSTTTTESASDQPLNMNTAKGELLVEMSKSACFGKCPVFTLKIFDNGRVEYHGVIHTDKLGVYSRQLDENSFYQIVRHLEATKLEQYEDFYSSGATDFPMTSITHYQRDSSKTVKGDFERPEPVRILEKQYETLANEGEWVQEEVPVPYSAIRNELIVELRAGFNASDLEQAFSDYELKVKKRIAPNLDLWVYEYNVEKVNPGRMVVLVREHEAVKMVEFNKNLEQRD